MAVGMREHVEPPATRESTCVRAPTVLRRSASSRARAARSGRTVVAYRMRWPPTGCEADPVKRGPPGQRPLAHALRPRRQPPQTGVGPDRRHVKPRRSVDGDVVVTTRGSWAFAGNGLRQWGKSDCPRLRGYEVDAVAEGRGPAGRRRLATPPRSPDRPRDRVRRHEPSTRRPAARSCSRRIDVWNGGSTATTPAGHGDRVSAAPSGSRAT